MKRTPAKSRRAPRPQEAAPVFAALGDATRLRLVADLCRRGPLSVARLTDAASVTRQAVTKHLRALEEAGLVRLEEEGRERLWQLSPARMREAGGFLDGMSAQWDAASRAKAPGPRRKAR